MTRNLRLALLFLGLSLLVTDSAMAHSTGPARHSGGIERLEAAGTDGRYKSVGDVSTNSPATGIPSSPRRTALRETLRLNAGMVARCSWGMAA